MKQRRRIDKLSPIEYKLLQFLKMEFAAYQDIDGTTIKGEVLYINNMTSTWNFEKRGWDYEDYSEVEFLITGYNLRDKKIQQLREAFYDKDLEKFFEVKNDELIFRKGNPLSLRRSKRGSSELINGNRIIYEEFKD